MTTIGQRIKNFRKSCGLSQAELAGKIGVTSQTVSKWE
ncbi:MAG: helix-turn-helix transcriptional regulator, partial [Clostridia bacterium]|nr:helix-turn-helix transcriptional regulator [Clostridia bacterium]